MKVLIIRFSSIGDIVLTTPVVRCTKQAHPDAEVHFLTKKSFRTLVEFNPYIDRVHLLDNSLDEVIEDLKKENFDYVIDLHNNLRTARVRKALDAPSKAFPKLNVKKWLYTNFKLDTMPDVSIVERYFEAAEPINAKNDGRGLDYFIPKHEEISNDDIPMSHWSGFVGAVIGGSYATKKLPVEQWRKFCSEIPYPVILMGGPEDREEGRQIAALDDVKIYNSCGKFTINETADLVRHSKVMVSNDTGLMHIAAAFKKPIVSLWGNTTPELGMYPYYGFNNLNKNVAPLSFMLENKDIGCRPCSKLGYDKCPKKHFNCMNQLDMNKAVEAVIKFWNIKN